MYGSGPGLRVCLPKPPSVGRLTGVDDPSAPDAQHSPRSGHRIPVDRAVILLGLFVLATVLLLGQLHHSTTGGSSAAPPTTSVSTTTVPGAASTTTTAPHTTTTTAPKAKPSNVPVLVANASGKPGAAATVTNELQVAGWNVQAPINATANVSTSAVYYVAGQKSAATAVAATLHLPSSAVLPYTTAAPVSTIGTAEILVVVAPDLATGATTTTTTGT